MTPAALAIHVEAWLQEELGAQRAILSALERIETAARSGSAAELERCGGELEGELARSPARDARRRALHERLAAHLGLPAHGLALSKLVARLAAAQVETARLESLRAELKEIVLRVVAASRRLAAVARYHRGVLDELCELLRSGADATGGRLVDACG